MRNASQKNFRSGPVMMRPRHPNLLRLTASLYTRLGLRFIGSATTVLSAEEDESLDEGSFLDLVGMLTAGRRHSRREGVSVGVARDGGGYRRLEEGSVLWAMCASNDKEEPHLEASRRSQEQEKVLQIAQ